MENLLAVTRKLGLGLALLAQQALKGRYWGQNYGAFRITPFQGLLGFPETPGRCPDLCYFAPSGLTKTRVWW